MCDSVTRKRSLDSLKKEAKRWLDALHRDVPDARTRFERVLPKAPAKPTLRDVQHAMALEHGVQSWTELKRKLTAAALETTKTLGQFERMAEALLEAYLTGSAEAMARHWALTWHRRDHRAMRTYVQLDLGRQPGDADQGDAEITRTMTHVVSSRADVDSSTGMLLSSITRACRCIRRSSRQSLFIYSPTIRSVTSRRCGIRATGVR